MAKKRESHFKKVAFTLLIAFAVISFWRGAWGLMDLYFFPSNHLVSLLVSLFLGISILYFTKHLIKHLI